MKAIIKLEEGWYVKRHTRQGMETTTCKKDAAMPKANAQRILDKVKMTYPNAKLEVI